MSVVAPQSSPRGWSAPTRATPPRRSKLCLPTSDLLDLPVPETPPLPVVYLCAVVRVSLPSSVPFVRVRSAHGGVNPSLHDLFASLFRFQVSIVTRSSTPDFRERNVMLYQHLGLGWVRVEKLLHSSCVAGEGQLLTRFVRSVYLVNIERRIRR